MDKQSPTKILVGVFCAVSKNLCNFAHCMKHLRLIYTAIAGLCLLAACKEKKPAQDTIIYSKQEVRKPQAPIKMQEYRQETDAQWLGCNYHISLLRTASDSLPMVQDEIGQKYVDNTVALTITREDASVFFKRTFTKGAFASYVDDDYRKNGILEAMIFEEVDDGRLEFAVSIAHPQSEDEFIPLKLIIDADKGLTIKRDNDIDTFGGHSDDEDDDD